jgi:hypothetical protein
VDYILTHEYPGRTGLYFDKNGRQNGVNAYLGLIESEVEYRRWFFGSLHTDKVMSRSLISVFRGILPVEESRG